MKTALVTGGAGFIGTNLVPRLLRAGYAVRVFDNGVGAVQSDPGPDVELLRGDVRDEEGVAAAVRGVSLVIHLAAAGSVVQSVNEPLENFDVNVRGTFNVLNASAKAGVEKLIFASTGGALIGNATPPVDEMSLPKPISPYGASKLCGEAYCHAFAQSYGLGTVALRFANVYGPHSHLKGGAVTAFIKALMTEQPIIIFGDGSASRDYIYVDDLCRGICLAIDAGLEPGEVLHLASGVETTVSQLAEGLIHASGKKDHKIEHYPARTGEVERNFATFDYASRRLGFHPEVKLTEGLRRTWRWFQESQSKGLAA